MSSKKVLSVIVDNNSGVLARIASLFGRRSYNIDSLTVSATDNPKISRITIVVQGGEEEIKQIISQTMKLEEVRDVYALEDEKTVMRELLLVKIAATNEKLGIIREIISVYGASIVDLSVNSVIIELTGLTKKIDGFLEVISQYEILEMCRTGITALERGETREQNVKTI